MACLGHTTFTVEEANSYIDQGGEGNIQLALRSESEGSDCGECIQVINTFDADMQPFHSLLLLSDKESRIDPRPWTSQIAPLHSPDFIFQMKRRPLALQTEICSE